MDIIFRSFLALMLLFVGLAALIGGIKKSPNPFFWTQPGRTSYLKKPVHYVLFGIACLLAVLYWVYRLMVIYHVF